MPTTTFSSREFNQDSGRAKRAAREGPVIITDRGEPTHVLLTYQDYHRLQGPKKNLAELLAMPDADDIEFEISPREVEIRPDPFD